ncbi:hypothetical protein BSL78_13999 [Apostichopus japonicus]|uniref:Uncharacterized protein n=1 Tax=Stichopus japonicus TaxID=307972 RepID=A0A2G8KME8_STIJA|nr:hypothetical protein BSL78_13999 [Apostichopus japonicus]
MTNDLPSVIYSPLNGTFSGSIWKHGKGFDNPSFDPENDVSDVKRNDPEKTPGAGDDCLTNSEVDKHGVQFIMWKYIDSVIQPVLEAVKEHKVIVKQAILLFALLLYLAGLIYACSRDFEKAKVMLILTGLAVCAAVYTFIRDFHGEAIWKNFTTTPCYNDLGEHG